MEFVFPPSAEDGARPLPFDRDTLGRMVREAWVRWANTQPSPKDSWLVPYENLQEMDKEADRQIGEAIARWTLIGDAAHQVTAPAVEDDAADARRWRWVVTEYPEMGWKLGTVDRFGKKTIGLCDFIKEVDDRIANSPVTP